MALLIGNFVEAVLGLAAPAAAGSITLISVPANFPAVGGGDTCYLVLEKGARGSASQREVVLATGVAGDVVAVTRGQDGTTALDFNPGDRVALRVVAGVLDSLTTRTATAAADAATGSADAATASADAATGTSDAAAAQADLNALKAVPFLVNAASVILTAETVRSAGTGVVITDNGANNTLDYAADPTIYMPRSGYGKQVLPGMFRRSTISLNFSTTSGVSWAFLIGKAEEAYTSAVVFFRKFGVTSGVSWAEVAVCTGAWTMGANTTLTARGWVSVASQVLPAFSPVSGTVALSGVTRGDLLWLVYGISATAPGSIYGSGTIHDPLEVGFFQTATVRPQSISGTAFTVVPAPTQIPALVGQFA